MPEVAKRLTRKAVESGNEVPELLMRYAEDVAESDPAASLAALRRAAAGDWPPSLALLRLGKAHAAAGNRPVAEACWRRAHRNATEEEKLEIHALMEVSPPEDEE